MEDTRVNVGQIFVRKTSDIIADNTYLVCGIIKTDKPLEEESVHTFTGDISIIGTENRRFSAMGKTLDGIIASPFWRVKIK